MLDTTIDDYDTIRTEQVKINNNQLLKSIENTLNPSFLMANITSSMYWTRLSIDASFRMLLSLSNTATKTKVISIF